MDSETPVTYSIEIISIRDEEAKNEIAGALTRVAKNIPEDRIKNRLNSLPWTVTQTTNKQNAERLAEMLRESGAEVRITPPLSRPAFEATQLVDQVFPSEQPGPAGRPPDNRPETPDQPYGYPPKPAPIEPGRAWQTREPQSPTVDRSPASAEQYTEIDDSWFSEPLSITGVLDRTFNICKTHLWNLVATAGVVWLVFALLFLIGTIGFAIFAGISVFAPFAAGRGGIGAGLIAVGVIVLVIISILFVIASYVAQGALVYAVSSIYLGREAPVKESYSAAWRKARKLILTGFIIMLLLFGLIFACTAAGALIYLLASFISQTFAIIITALAALPLFCIPFYVVAKMSLIDKIIMIEGTAYSDALRRSWDLLSGKAAVEWPKGFFTRFIILGAIAWLVTVGISLLCQIPGTAMTLAGLNVSGMVVNQLLGIIAKMVGVIFYSVSMVVFYYDIRNRKEGFDLQQLASQYSR